MLAMLFLGVMFWTAARVVRLFPCGRKSNGTAFVRADLRFPSCRKEVGPLTSTLLHGGESGLDDDLCVKGSAIFRFFTGRPSLWESL